MSYKIKFEKKAEKQLMKIDATQRRMIIDWISKNLDQTSDPKKLGKPLKGRLSEYWRYRIGNYRLIVDIKDNEFIIIVVQVAHRQNVYKR